MANDSTVSVPQNPQPSSGYSPPYPWAETGVILFLVLSLGLVFVRWLPGYLSRRENDARAARDAVWLAELRREEDEKVLRDTLLSKHLNQSQTFLEDLLTTQDAIAAMAEVQRSHFTLSREIGSRLIRLQMAQLAEIRRLAASLESLQSARLKGELSSSEPQSAQLTRPKGVGQSPYESVHLENSGIDC